MRPFAIAILTAAAALPAGPGPAGFQLWKSSDLQAFQQKLSPKINAQKVATQPLASYGNHNVLVAHREGNGEAELHETQSDVIVIESGEATMVVGGAVVDPKTTAPHEIRGPSIKGGEKKSLAAGDVVHIAIKVPHQMFVETGKQVTYFVVKVNAQ